MGKKLEELWVGDEHGCGRGSAREINLGQVEEEEEEG